MKSADANKTSALIHMDEKRQMLEDQLTRALCGDANVDTALLDEATGGWFSGPEEDDVEAIGTVIKKMILALRWLGVPPEKKRRKRASRAKSKGSNGKGATPVKKRGRPKGSKNKAKPPQEPPPEEPPSQTGETENRFTKDPPAAPPSA